MQQNTANAIGIADQVENAWVRKPENLSAAARETETNESTVVRKKAGPPSAP